jgi:hypothetical protein
MANRLKYGKVRTSQETSRLRYKAKSSTHGKVRASQETSRHRYKAKCSTHGKVRASQETSRLRYKAKCSTHGSSAPCGVNHMNSLDIRILRGKRAVFHFAKSGVRTYRNTRLQMVK